MTKSILNVKVLAIVAILAIALVFVAMSSSITATADSLPTLTVTAQDVTVILGQKASFTYKTSGLSAGDSVVVGFECAYDADTAQVGETYDIIVTATNDSYDINTVNGTLTVVKSTVSAPRAVITTLVYNGQEQCGITNIDDSLYTIEGHCATDAGTYTATATILDSDSYQFSGGGSEVTITYTIQPLAIDVVVDDVTTTFGSDAQYSASSTGLLGEDTLDALFDSEYSVGSNVGSYDITLLSINSNYSISSSNIGSLTVTQLVIDAPTASQVEYNGQLQCGVLALDGVYSVSGQATDAGTYTAVVTMLDTTNSVFTGGVSTVNISYTIVPKSITVTVDDMSTVYGTQLDAYSFTVDGLVDGDSLSVQYSCEYTIASVVGTYSIVGSVTHNNYDITIVNGTLTVTSAPVVDGGSTDSEGNNDSEGSTESEGSTGGSLIWLYVLLAVAVVAVAIVLIRKKKSNDTTPATPAEQHYDDSQTEDTVVATVVAEDTQVVEDTQVATQEDTTVPVVVEDTTEQETLTPIPVVEGDSEEDDCGAVVHSTAIVEDTTVAMPVAHEDTIVVDTTEQETFTPIPVVEGDSDEGDGGAVAVVLHGVADDDTVDVAEDTQAEPVVVPVAKPKVKYRRGFMANMILADEDIKHHYHLLKNAIMSYSGVSSRVSWSFDSFNLDRQQKVKIRISRKTLIVYLALDPSQYIDTLYHVEDASAVKRYSKVPAMIKVKGIRSTNRTIKLIDILFKDAGKSDRTEVDYHFPTETIESLAQRDLVKEVKPRTKKTPLA